MGHLTSVACLGLSLFSLSCSDDETSSPPGGNAGSGGSGNTALVLTSTAFAEGEMIPQKYTCTDGGGQNVSPPLVWTGGPAAAQSYAIVMRDLDFQSGFLHWVIFDIPKGEGLTEGIENAFRPAVPAGAKQSSFLTGTPGYFGPCSPMTVNTYEFTLHALPEKNLSGLAEQSANQDAASVVEAGSMASTKLSGES